jgi:hypothetical protein
VDSGIEVLDCSADFRSSAIISVKDKDGAPLSDVNVSYSVDGIEGEFVDHWQNGSVIVGGEESGEFVVNLYAEIPFENDACCWDIGEAELEFSIEANECHVITQEFEANLEWSVLCADTSDLVNDCE